MPAVDHRPSALSGDAHVVEFRFQTTSGGNAAGRQPVTVAAGSDHEFSSCGFHPMRPADEAESRR